MDWCVCDLFRLVDNREPLRRLQRIERENRAVASKVTALLPLDIADQLRFGARSRFGLRFKIGGEERKTLLIDNLANGAIRKGNRGKPAAEPLN